MLTDLSASSGGGADVDTFQYDPNTNRPTSLNYFVDASANQFNVHTQLNWNANGSLSQMVYTDENDTSKNQTCAYAADDLSRIVSAQCNGAWAQTFSYDPFGNISKAGSSSYAATYGGPNSATKTNQVSGGFSPAPTYDLNGNQLNLTAAPASIGWNAWNVPTTISGTSATYDALGRMVEKVAGGTATQFVYSASGTNIASVSGGVLIKGTVQLPGGDTAIYSGTSGNPYIRHTDWLGSSRLATTWAHAVQSKIAYAPFGETYNEAGAAANDRSFTGQDQNVVQGSLGTGVYDYLFRKYDPSAGRWLSPDPAGWGAAKINDPQSLDRYAYVENQPLSSFDPSGQILCSVVSGDDVLWYDSGSDSCGSNYTDVLNQSIVVYADGCSGSNPNSADCMQLNTYSYSWQMQSPDLSYQLAVAMGSTDYKSLFCAGDALKNNGVSLALDAAGFILPAKGAIGAATQTVSGVASTFNSLSHQDGVGAAAGVTGEGLGLTYGGALALGASWAELIPGVSTVVNIGISARDAYNTYKSYSDCMKSSKYD